MFSYNSRVPLNPRVVKRGSQGAVHLQWIDYTSSDGSRVPALLATPIAGPARGCVMYQGGAGQTKEEFPQLRDGLAALGLATFTIDPRNTGSRGSDAQLRAAFATPQGIASELSDTVVDLRRGLDYLESRSFCRHNVGYLGTSMGGALGALFAGQDPRIRAVVLTSIGATFKEAMLISEVAVKSNPQVPVLVPGVSNDPARFAAAVRILSPYDPANWVPKISPRPLMLVNGRFDPVVTPADALEIADAAQQPKTILYFNGGHDPFAAGPDQLTVDRRVAQFFCAYLNTCPTSF